MKKILPATLVALLAAPGCGGAREEAPGATPPVPGTATTHEMVPTPEATPSEPPVEPAPTTTAPAPKPPLAELERDAIRTMMSAFNAHDAHKIAMLYAPEARIGGATPAGWTEESGRSSVENVHNQLFSAFPDMKWASPRVYQTGNVVVQEWALTGTHQGDLGSLKATNKPIGLAGASVYWFNDEGLILRDSTYYDAASIGAQIGATKAKGRPVPELSQGEPEFLTATGTPDENRWVNAAKALYTAYDNRDEKGFFGALAKDVLVVDYTAPADRTGAGPAREGFRAFLRAFPDVKVTSRNVWGFGDRVVAEVAYTGTQTGIYAGVKPTKKPVTLHALEVLRFDEDGKVVERTSYASTMELSATGAQPSVPGKSAPDTRNPEPVDPDSGQPSPGYHMSPSGNQYYPPPNPLPGAPRPGPTSPVPAPPGGGVQ